jgi:hypothetical protein
LKSEPSLSISITKGCPPKEATNDETAEAVHDLVMCDKRRDLRSIAREVGIRFRSVKAILTDVYGMSKVSARWVPRQLTDDQKRTRLNISRYLLSRYEDEPDFIYRIVTQDENGLITSIQNPKVRACSGSTLAHPLRRNSRWCH